MLYVYHQDLLWYAGQTLRAIPLVANLPSLLVTLCLYAFLAVEGLCYHGTYHSRLSQDNRAALHRTYPVAIIKNESKQSNLPTRATLNIIRQYRSLIEHHRVANTKSPQRTLLQITQHQHSRPNTTRMEFIMSTFLSLSLSHFLPTIVSLPVTRCTINLLTTPCVFPVYPLPQSYPTAYANISPDALNPVAVTAAPLATSAGVATS